jgi:hypothetical protein
MLAPLLSIPAWAYVLAAFTASFAVFVATALTAAERPDQEGSAD